MTDNNVVKELITKYFSLQWCRENLVVPLELEASSSTSPSKITIAVGNITYLGTIGNLIKERVYPLNCRFEELSPDKINELIDLAA